MVRLLILAWNLCPVINKILTNTTRLPGQNSIFAILTTAWIGLGGVSQLILFIYLLFRQDDRINILPKWTQIGLLFATTILMGPVLINLYGAFYVFQNRNKEHNQESVKRYLVFIHFFFHFTWIINFFFDARISSTFSDV